MIKKNVDEFLSKGIYIMIFVFSMVGLNLLRCAKVANITYWEYIISAMTNHYYILYFMIIFYLFSVFKIIKDDNEIILIRRRKYIDYFIVQAISLLLISTIFVLIHFFIVAIMGYGLNMGNRFIKNINYYNYNEVIGIYSMYFKSPILAIITCAIYMILGLTFMSIVLMFLNNFLGKKLVVLCIVVMYILMLISLRTDVDKFLPLVFMNNYIILHHALAVLEKRFYIMIICEMFLSGFILLIIKKSWYKEFTLKKKLILMDGINNWYLKILFSRKNIFIMIAFIIISAVNISLKNDVLTINDLIVLQFYGHGIGYFNLMDFISLVIYNGIPIYVLAYFLEKENNDRSTFVTIRLKNKKQWFKSVMQCGFLLIFIYVLVSICITVIIGTFLGMRFSGYNYVKDLFLKNGLKITSPFCLYLIILTSKSLELIFYFLVVFTSYIYTKGATTGFLLVQLGYVSYFLPQNIAKYIPIGIASLSRMGEFVGNNGISYIFIMGILIMLNTMLYFYLKIGAYKRIFN
ncbi:hypothetical protein [Clostridium tepidiprofundi]|nr:hypothetical protein [Clostridium tepidiprofundi]